MKKGIAGPGNRRWDSSNSPMQIQKSLLSQSRREWSHGTLGKSSATETIVLSWEERVTKADLKGK